jgi:hypothetical protein
MRKMQEDIFALFHPMDENVLDGCQRLLADAIPFRWKGRLDSARGVQR